jgi:hypothetical protein
MVLLATDFKVLHYGSGAVLASELVLIDDEEVAPMRCRAAGGRQRLRPTSTRYFLNEEVCGWTGLVLGFALGPGRWVGAGLRWPVR